MEEFWFVTVFEKEAEDHGDKWTVGFFEHYEDAKAVLHENRTDLHETCYNYAVVEKYTTGLGGYCNEREFFKYDKERNGFFAIETPKCFEHLCAFALGW